MLVFATDGHARSGDFDPTFAPGDLAEGPEFAIREILFRDDGRILLVGHGWCRSPYHRVELMATQLLPDGAVDPGFGDDGHYCQRVGPYTAGAFADALLDRKGRLLIAGKRELESGLDDSLLIRLTRRGQLDPTFSGNGKRLFDFGDSERAASVLRDGPGRLLVGLNSSTHEGDRRDLLLRLRSDGKLDRSFSGNGLRRAPAWVDQFFRMSNGKIVVMSSRPYRLRANHELDRTYGRQGFAERKPANNRLLGGDSALAPDGGLFWSGHTWNSPGSRIALVRWRRDGQLDRAWGGDGLVTTRLGTTDPASSDQPYAEANGVAVQADGKAVITGGARYYDDPACESHNSWRGLVARYALTGELDQSFGDGGVVHFPGCFSFGMSGELRAISIQPWDRRIVTWALPLRRLLP